MSSVLSELSSKSWWQAAGFRALRTATAVLIPFFVATTFLDLDWKLIGSTVAFSVILSFVTSLAGLKEVVGETTSRAWAIFTRSTKTFAQTMISYLGAATLLHEVDWQSSLLLSGSAAVVSILQGVLTELPEEDLFKQK